MGSVLIFNRKNSRVHEESDKESSDIGTKLNSLSEKSLPPPGVEKLHCELQTVVTLLEAALKEIGPLITTMNKSQGDDQIRRAFALARLEVECAKFTVARLDNLIGRF